MRCVGAAAHVGHHHAAAAERRRLAARGRLRLGRDVLARAHPVAANARVLPAVVAQLHPEVRGRDQGRPHAHLGAVHEEARAGRALAIHAVELGRGRRGVGIRPAALHPADRGLEIVVGGIGPEDDVVAEPAVHAAGPAVIVGGSRGEGAGQPVEALEARVRAESIGGRGAHQAAGVHVEHASGLRAGPRRARPARGVEHPVVEVVVEEEDVRPVRGRHAGGGVAVVDVVVVVRGERPERGLGAEPEPGAGVVPGGLVVQPPVELDPAASVPVDDADVVAGSEAPARGDHPRVVDRHGQRVLRRGGGAAAGHDDAQPLGVGGVPPLAGRGGGLGSRHGEPSQHDPRGENRPGAGEAVPPTRPDTNGHLWHCLPRVGRPEPNLGSTCKTRAEGKAMIPLALPAARPTRRPVSGQAKVML